MSSSRLRCSPLAKRDSAIGQARKTKPSKKKKGGPFRPLMCIITQSFNKTWSKFSAMCEVFFLFPVKISHVSFQLAVSLPPTGAVCEIVCMSPSTSHCEEEKIAAAKE